MVILLSEGYIETVKTCLMSEVLLLLKIAETTTKSEHQKVALF